MNIYIRPIINRTGSRINRENPDCLQAVYTCVFSSKRGITVAPLWVDIDLISGFHEGMIYVRTDLICRASETFLAAHGHNANLWRREIVKVPIAMMMENPNRVMNFLLTNWKFRLKRKEMKKQHKKLRKQAEASILQPAQ